MFRHTYTEDVEAESLCNRFADQLIWKTVKANMPPELQVSLFFILRYLETGRTKTKLGQMTCLTLLFQYSGLGSKYQMKKKNQ